MYLAKWKWRNEYKVFLIDEEDDLYTRKKAKDVVGAGGALLIEEVVYDDVLNVRNPDQMVHNIAMIMSSY